MVFDPFTIGLVVGGLAKVFAGKAVVAKGVALAGKTSIHAAHAAHAAGHVAHAAAGHALTTSQAVAIVEGVGGIALGAVGADVLQRLLEGRNVGPTGEKIASKAALFVEHDVIEYEKADDIMDAVENLDEYEKQDINKMLDKMIKDVKNRKSGY